MGKSTGVHEVRPVADTVVLGRHSIDCGTAEYRTTHVGLANVVAIRIWSHAKEVICITHKLAMDVVDLPQNSPYYYIGNRSILEVKYRFLMASK